MKNYCFDYIKENVDGWLPEFKKNITKDMILTTPYGLFFWSDLFTGCSLTDYYGEPIEDFEDWKRQREEYIDNLYNTIKNEER